MPRRPGACIGAVTLEVSARRWEAPAGKRGSGEAVGTARRGRGRLARLSVAGVVAFVAVAVLASSASGTTASGTDPLHDNGNGFDARGDVTAFSISYTAASVSVSTTVATFAN